MNRNELKAVALRNLRASKSEAWSYLCECVETFGFFLWAWCEEQGVERDVNVVRRLAESGEFGVAWIVPIRASGKVEGYALFLGHAESAPEDEPTLDGIYGSPDEAKETLRKFGAIDEKVD